MHQNAIFDSKYIKSMPWGWQTPVETGSHFTTGNDLGEGGDRILHACQLYLFKLYSTESQGG